MRCFLLWIACLCSVFLTLPFRADGIEVDPELADVPSQDFTLGKDPNKRYFLIGPRTGAAAPAEGYKLLVVLPGGGGNAEFLPFVQRISKHALPQEYLVAQLVAPKWSADQPATWPTAKSRVAKMKFTTEEFLSAVIDDAAKRHKLDPRHCYTLSWSSGGPAGYAAALSNQKITGSFVAMSVFKPDQLPPLKQAEGKAFYLYHSSEDRICPFRMAEQAQKSLAGSKAKVELKKYAGGHGWRGPVFDEIRTGIEWLEINHSAPPQP